MLSCSIEERNGLLASGRWRPFPAYGSGTPENCHMSDILIYCPVTGQPVPTGLDTETVIFESLPNVEIPVRAVERCIAGDQGTLGLQALAT